MITAPGAPSPIAALPNLRDLGGWAAQTGTVRSGMLFRSADFSGLTVGDIAALALLGLRTIYDLRSAGERAAVPDPALPGVGVVHVDVLASAAQAVPANIVEVFANPAAVAATTEALGDGKAAALIVRAYRDFVSLDSAHAGYRTLFRGLLGEHPQPALFHCAHGKDRTGWAAAAFLLLMGVGRDDVYHDYLLTNERLVPAFAPVFDAFAAAGGDPELLRPVFGVDESYLDAALGEVDETFGGIGGYFAAGLGIDETEQERLRRLYLQ
ncbi:MAG: tyrosine-protein phosphatase [Gordonia sp. (in: high G+C Gram-positive bacteria)]